MVLYQKSQSPCIIFAVLDAELLIAYLLEEEFPNPEDINEQAIGDLQVRDLMIVIYMYL